MTLYQLIGTDGREYGPASADQVRQWIREHRVERQTPVFVPGSTNWTYVGLLPEFVHDFPNTVAGCALPLLGTIAPVRPLRIHSMAKAGLACGILAVTVGCCCAGIPFNVLGLVFSIMALVQIADHPQQYRGRGLAILGLLLSACGFAIFSLVFLLR